MRSRPARRKILAEVSGMTGDGPFLDDPDRSDPAAAVRRLADRVASMIVTSSYSDLDCALAEREARMECLRLLPDKLELWDRVYGARFRRLREQFRD